jgi:Glycosyltransferase family 87
MPTSRVFTLSPFGMTWLRRVAILAAVVGTALGIETLLLHMSTDPFADTRLYYDAGARLNAGLPLYLDAIPGAAGPYTNPPLLAIAFRPLALLPFPVAAAIWEAILLVAFALTLWRIRLREPVVIALGCLALPILWALSIGQSEVLVTLLLTLGTPLSVAFAGNLKLVPFIAGVYWVARRDRRALVGLVAWAAAIGLVQLVLEPAATLEYLSLDWLQSAFGYRNVSPFVIHPLLWVALVAILAGLALRYGRTRYGWPLALVLAVFANPRLLVYQLMTLLAAFGGPRTGTTGDGTPVPVTGRTTRH